LDKSHHRLELMRIEVGVARLHRIEDVCEFAFDFFEDQNSSKVARPAKCAGFQQVKDFFVLAYRLQQLISLRSEEHTSELQSRENLVCRLLLEKKKPHHTSNIQYA